MRLKPKRKLKGLREKLRELRKKTKTKTKTKNQFPLLSIYLS